MPTLLKFKHLNYLLNRPIPENGIVTRVPNLVFSGVQKDSTKTGKWWFRAFANKDAAIINYIQKYQNRSTLFNQNTG